MAGPNTPIIAPILRLPAELHDKIFRCLTPDQKKAFEARTYTGCHRSVRPGANECEPIDWQKVARSLRCTCISFSNSKVLKEALFYEINIFAAPLSSQRLQSISLDPDLAGMVQSAIFHQPLINFRFPNEGVYRIDLQRRLKFLKQDALPITGLGYFSSAQLMRMLADEQVPFRKTLEDYRSQLLGTIRNIISTQADEIEHNILKYDKLQLSLEELKDSVLWLTDNFVLFNDDEVLSCYRARLRYEVAVEDGKTESAWAQLAEDIQASFRRSRRWPTTTDIIQEVADNIRVHALDSSASRLVDKHFPFTNDQVASGYQAYERSLRIQEEQEMFMIQRLADALSKLPNLKIILIGDPTKREDSSPKWKEPVHYEYLVRRFYPGVLLGSTTGRYEPYGLVNKSYAPQVLSALSLAGVAPEQLLFNENITLPRPRCRPYRKRERVTSWRGLDPSKLRTLEFGSIRSRHHSPLDLTGAEATLSKTLDTIMSAAHALQNLRLIVNEELDENGPPFANIAKNLSNLRSLHLCGYGIIVDEEHLMRILQANTKLEELKLCDVRLLRGRWRQIFEAVRQHKAITNIEFRSIESTEDPQFYFLEEPFDGEIEEQTIAYVRGSGEWTELLEDAWEDQKFVFD